jgi:hypothetical protein
MYTVMYTIEHGTVHGRKQSNIKGGTVVHGIVKLFI